MNAKERKDTLDRQTRYLFLFFNCGRGLITKQCLPLSLSLSLSKSLHLLLSFFPFQVPTFPQQNEAIPTSSKDILFSSFHSFSLPLLRSQKKRTKCGKNSPVNHPLENLSKFLKLIYNMPMRCKAYNFIHSLTPMLILIFYQ